MNVLKIGLGAVAGSVAGHWLEAVFKTRLLTVDPIESTMIGEMRGLGTGPAAEYGIDGNESWNVGELLRVAGGNGGIAGSVEVFGRDFLSLGGVEIFQVFLGDLAGPVLVDVLVHQADRRLRDDAERRRDDVELRGTQLLDGQKGLIFPGQQHVADTPFHEGHRCASGSGIENGYVMVE